MSQLIISIALWCSNTNTGPIAVDTCQKKILKCIIKDARLTKPGSFEFCYLQNK